MDLTDRVVGLTGAKRVGPGGAGAVAARGAHVAIAYNRSAAEAEDATTAITAKGRKAIAVQADVSDPVACAKLVGAVERELGRPDVLINMASLYHEVPFDQLDVAG